MAEPLSIAAGVVGLVSFAGSTLAHGYTVLHSLQNSKEDITRLLTELSQLTGILAALRAQEHPLQPNSDEDNTDPRSLPEIIQSSVTDCHQAIKRVDRILSKLETSRRAVMAVKWQFLELDVRKSIQEIEHYKTMFILCLGVDTR